MARQTTRARGLAQRKEDLGTGNQAAFLSRVAPTLAGTGQAAGTTAKRTERFQRGITQGARFQRELRQQDADTAARERGFKLDAEKVRLGEERFKTQLGAQKAESEADRAFRLGEGQKSRDFAAGEGQKSRDFRAGESEADRLLRQKTEGARIGLGIRGQDLTVGSKLRAGVAATQAGAAKSRGAAQSQLLDLQRKLGRAKDDDNDETALVLEEQIKGLKEQLSRPAPAATTPNVRRPSLGRGDRVESKAPAPAPAPEEDLTDVQKVDSLDQMSVVDQIQANPESLSQGEKNGVQGVWVKDDKGVRSKFIGPRELKNLPRKEYLSIIDKFPALFEATREAGTKNRITLGNRK